MRDFFIDTYEKVVSYYSIVSQCSYISVQNLLFLFAPKYPYGVTPSPHALQ